MCKFFNLLKVKVVFIDNLLQKHTNRNIENINCKNYICIHKNYDSQYMKVTCIAPGTMWEIGIQHNVASTCIMD